MGRRKSSEYWYELISLYESEKEFVTQEEFATAYGVSASTFRAWLYRIRQENRGGEVVNQSVGFVEVSINDLADSKKSEYGKLQLWTSGDVKLEFGSLPPVDYLAELVKALGEQAC